MPPRTSSIVNESVLITSVSTTTPIGLNHNTLSSEVISSELSPKLLTIPPINEKVITIKISAVIPLTSIFLVIARNSSACFHIDFLFVSIITSELNLEMPNSNLSSYIR